MPVQGGREGTVTPANWSCRSVCGHHQQLQQRTGLATAQWGATTCRLVGV